MNALLKHPQFRVNLYKKNPGFKERGAGVGLAANARRALDLLGLGSVPEKAQGGTGEEVGTTAVDVEHPLITVHRAALSKQLVSSIPQDRLHFNKRLSTINDNVIHFVDGTSATADLIIGADGIHSNVRKSLLGEKHPALDPVFCGFWDSRAIVPVQIAIDALGPLRIDRDHPRQHVYAAEKSFFIHDMLEDGNFVCVIGGGAAPSSWGGDQWKRSVTREWLDEFYGQWGEFGQVLLNLMCAGQKETTVFLEWESARAPKLYNGSLCMIGDAAHATTPWQGSGFALAIEDSLVLSSTLGQYTSLKDVPAALEAYDQVMRPRGQRIIESSRGVGELCMRINEFDTEQLRRELPPRWDFIHDWDTAGAVKEASAIFESVKGAQ